MEKVKGQSFFPLKAFIIVLKRARVVLLARLKQQTLQLVNTSTTNTHYNLLRHKKNSSQK